MNRIVLYHAVLLLLGLLLALPIHTAQANETALITDVELGKLANSFYVRVVRTSSDPGTIYYLSGTDWNRFPRPIVTSAEIIDEYSEGQHTWEIRQGKRVFVIE